MVMPDRQPSAGVFADQADEMCARARDDMRSLLSPETLQRYQRDFGGLPDSEARAAIQADLSKRVAGSLVRVALARAIKSMDQEGRL